MDTIKTYLDSLFASLPDNAKTQQAKTDMLANMRDYYRDLLRDGKSEEIGRASCRERVSSPV